MCVCTGVRVAAAGYPECVRAYTHALTGRFTPRLRRPGPARRSTHRAAAAAARRLARRRGSRLFHYRRRVYARQQQQQAAGGCEY